MTRKEELVGILKSVNDRKNFLSLSIMTFFERDRSEEELDKMIRELVDLTKDNPPLMAQAIGQRAVNLLMRLYGDV